MRNITILGLLVIFCAVGTADPRNAGEAFRETPKIAGEAFRETPRNAVEAFRETPRNAGEAFRETPRNAVKAFRETPRNAVKAFRETPRNAVKAFRETPRNAVKAFRETPRNGVKAFRETSAAQPAPATCDRECLRGKVTQLLNALVTHDVKGLPVADTLRVTEDAVEKPLARVGLVGTVTRLRGFRQDIIDERAGVAGAHVVVEESGAPVLLVVRLKVVADKLTEIELVATRSRAEGLIFNIEGLSTPSAVMNYAPRPEQLAARDEAIKAALHYPQGLNTAKTFAAVNAPFAPGAYRHENGQVMAGPACTFAPGCQNISTQSLAIFERLGDVQTRVIAADERMGIVWLRMAWGVRERGGDQLTVWEMFKVYDDQIHAVEAFMRILPVEKRNGGWE